MIQKLNGTLKAEVQIISRHHQSSVDHDVIVSWYIKCSLVDMFILVKDESNTLALAFWHRIWPLQNVDFLSFVIT
jgi:hypothetical protein